MRFVLFVAAASPQRADAGAAAGRTQDAPAARLPLQCGPGTQLLRWLATSACARLAFMTGARAAAAQLPLPRSRTQALTHPTPRLALCAAPPPPGDHASRFVPQSVCAARAPQTPLNADAVRAGFLIRRFLATRCAVD